MEKAHWLGRKRASLKLAKNAESAEARLVHYDLAGRYGLKAISAETAATDLAGSLPPRILADPANVNAKSSRAQMDESRGSPKDADDAIDEMIRRNVQLHGA